MSVFNASRLLGKTVLITGASSGIGKVSFIQTLGKMWPSAQPDRSSSITRKATAVLFAKGGANVILTARRADALQKVAEECAAAYSAAGIQQGGKFVSIALDVSDKNQIASFLEKVPTELLNNAGYVVGVDRVGDLSLENMENMFATNVFGLVALTQLFIKDFKARKTGHVINLGSIAGREPYAGGGIYCATKHAVNAFTGVLMRELVDTPIRVTEIQPGMVETEFSVVRFKGDKSAADKVYEGIQPCEHRHRIPHLPHHLLIVAQVAAEDIAEEIVWAASRPSHVNIAEVFVLPVNQATATLNYRSPKL
ncbi:NAD(P)-binding protein [Lanmaoa asiatica]|nr:NAD(P)-binding protein [Lanmaoa asiatica]